MFETTLSLSETREEFSRRMRDFESRLQKASNSSPDVAGIASEFAAFKELTLKSLGDLQHQVDLLAREVDQLEMRSRRKILLFHGVSETKQEDTAAVVKSVVVGQLKLTEFTVDDISRCHRMGRAVSADKSRPILVKLRDVSCRDKIWFAKSNLKGSSITVSEFLTKARHEAFMEARQRFGIKKCWSRDGYIYVLGPDGSRHRITRLAELHKVSPLEPVKPALVKEVASVPAVKPKRTAAAKK